MPIPTFTYSQKLDQYMLTTHEYMNFEAIFSDETELFVMPTPCNPGDTVTIQIRTAKNNVDSVFLVLETEKKEMTVVRSDEFFDFYQTTILVGEKNILYDFSLTKNDKSYFYNKAGVTRDQKTDYHFVIMPGFHTPKWAIGAVMYQIYIDRFCNGDPTNDVVNNEYAYIGTAAKQVPIWNTPITGLDISNFYGGDLQGVIDKMSYLKDLGVEVIYFNPIFVSPSNHKYDIQDYDYVDPHVGVIKNDSGEPLYFEKFHNRFATKYTERTTNKENLEASNELLCKLIEIAHANGIKVILDGVFNHCGAFNKWMDKEGFYQRNKYPVGAYRDENSTYHNYFRWYDKNWPNNDCYDCWWGHDNHPKLNFEASPELYEYFMQIAKKYVSAPFYADGWRLDVAADLGYSPEMNHRFWRDFRKSVKEANPEAIILAEHYGDPQSWLQGDQWDTIMNYDAFMEPITWFLTGMQKHSEEFRPDLLRNAIAFEGAMRYHMAKHSIHSLQITMNQLSNHDHSRFLTRTNMTPGRLHTKGWEAASDNINKNIMMEAVTFQMTWPGAPSVYYGDEVGVVGWTDPDNRRTYPWGREDYMLLAFHKEIIRIHKENSALKSGSVEYLILDSGFISYGRFNADNTIAVLLNNNETEKQVLLPVWKIQAQKNGTMEQLITTQNNDFVTDSIQYPIVNGILTITVPPYSSTILKEIPTE